MNKYAFLSNETVKRFILAFFIFGLFGFTTFAFLTLLLAVILFTLFRKKKRDANDIRLSEGTLLLSPINGKFIGTEEQDGKLLLKFKIKFLSCYGLYMPTNGEIVDYRESVEASTSFLKPYRSQVEIVDKSENHFRFIFQCLNISMRPRVLVRSGDKGKIGGLMGFFPFGGKVFLEIPLDSEVVLTEKERVVSSQTVVAKIKE